MPTLNEELSTMGARLFLTTIFSLLGVALPEAGLASRVDGSCLESFALENFQPRSPTFQRTVSSLSYRNRTTVVMLLVGS